MLARHPGVADVAVVGIPDAEWGEIVCAVVVVVVPSGTATPDLEDAPGDVRRDARPVQTPPRVVVVDRIPRTAATGQVQRRLLAERFA